MACLSFDTSRKKWRVRWQVRRGKVKVFHGSKSFSEKPQAIRLYAQMEELEGARRTGNTVSPRSVIQAREDFFRYIKRHTARTQEGYIRILNDFVGNLPVMLVEQIGPEHLQDYIHRLRVKGLSNRTINNHLIACKAFLRFCSEQFRIANVASGVHLLKEEPPKQRFLTPDEFSAILKVATPLAIDRLLFIANTGLRASEFASLNLNCIQNETLTITGKGRKRRSIPLNSVALDILKHRNIEELKVSRSVLLHQCYRIAKKALVQPFGPHSARHYFATELLKCGVAVKKVSVLLGHESVETTEKTYAHILPTDLQKTTEVLVRQRP